MPRCRFLILLALLAACGSDYSPDTYATRAVQQANRVEPGTVIGRREVQVSADGSTGAATGAAAGGVVGSQTPGGGIGAALGGVGGALLGGLIGTAAEHTVVDTKAFEYIVRTAKEELLSVTQRDTTPLVVGQRVLVITGNQARIVPDYTTATAPARPPAEASPPAAAPAPGPQPAGIPAVPPPPVVAPPPPPPAETPVTEAPAASPLRDAAEAAAIARLPPVAQPVARTIADQAAAR